MSEDPFSHQHRVIELAIADLEKMNADPATRSRELSLAITNLQQGLLWLNAAPIQNDDEE